MAPSERRLFCVHTTAGAVLQYRHMEKLIEFIIDRARHPSLFRDLQIFGNQPAALQRGETISHCLQN
jgi:hypothetical protein